MMKTISKKLSITLLGILFIFGCDHELPDKKNDNLTLREKLMARDWQYNHVIMGDSIIDSLTPNGEPRVGKGTYEAAYYRYLRYSEEGTYELRWEVPHNFTLGDYENYQPNYGTWEFSDNEDTLIHNRIHTYETKYVIQMLTADTLKRKLVGDRICYFGNREDIIIDTVVVNNWVEVFISKK